MTFINFMPESILNLKQFIRLNAVEEADLDQQNAKHELLDDVLQDGT